MNRYNLCVLVILWIIAPFSHSAGNGNANIPTSNSSKNSSFNLKTLYAKNQYSALEYGKYDPSHAIRICPHAEIWPEAADLPKPPLSDCTVSGATGGVNTQVAYGCKVDPTAASDNIGMILSRSVVAIAIPDRTKSGDLYWSTGCTGTIVGGGKWILTAAHCLADPEDGAFNEELSNRPIYIIPWQRLSAESYGVPTFLTRQNFHDVTKFEVASAYISKDFKSNPTGYSYSGYIRNDFALLQLKDTMPDSYKSIDIASERLPKDGPLILWLAGYGVNENQIKDGLLHYRKEYYMTNEYDNRWFGGISGNYGQIYTLGSMPELYHGESSAWSFNGPGDSGGPVMLYDKANKKFYIEGILSAGGCNYAGYFAKLPYSYAYSVSTTDSVNQSVINSIIDGTIVGVVKCVSATDWCMLSNLYVINQNNTISSYIGAVEGNLHYVSSVGTGLLPTQIAVKKIKDYKYVYVTNYVDSTISSYIVSSINGNLTRRLPATTLNGKGPVDIKINGDYAYIVQYLSNSMSIYHLNFYGELTYIESMATKSRPVSMTIKNGHAFVASSGFISIYRLTNTGATHLDDYQLPESYGIPIEIISRSAESSEVFNEDLYPDELYLLTRLGIFIYKVEDHGGRPNLILKGSLSERFDTNDHIKSLNPESFAISTTLARNIRIYHVDNAYNISLGKVLYTPPATGMETARDVGDPHNLAANFFYTADFNAPNLSVFRGEEGFKNLTHVSDVYTKGNNPSIIKYVEWYK